MRIGIPREIKPLEGRVALTPDACQVLTRAGHEIFLEHQAGSLSGYPDDDYARVGVTIVPDAAALYGTAQLIVKVKEPQPVELGYLQAHHILFSFLHIAPDLALAQGLRKIGLTALAFETLQDRGVYPILEPMSEIAGKIAVQVGTHLLHVQQGGSGILLGGVAGADRGNVLVLGAGTAGGTAASVAHALGATVTLMDINPGKLASFKQRLPDIHVLDEAGSGLSKAVAKADLIVGAVMVAGARAPVVISEDQVKQMRPGSVIVDIAIDQGGCVATSRVTDYRNPVFTRHGVQHFCVSNMPSAVPRTASQVLSSRILPYLQRLLEGNWADDPALRSALNVAAGDWQHPALKAQFAQ